MDQTGVGAGVVDQLKRTRHPVAGVSFSQTPLEPDRFLNRRAEMWWRVREWLEKGASLEMNAELRSDLIGPEYYLSASGKIQLESKDGIRRRGLASPDLGDALALTFAMPVYPRAPEAAGAGMDAGSDERGRYDVYDWMERK